LIIGQKQIVNNKSVFVIAEAGINHNNKLSLAYKMIDIAVKAGADAVKFQTFIADNLHLPNSVKPGYQNKIKGKNYYEIIKELETSFEDQVKLFNYCKKKNIIFLSTPYDKDSVDFLNDLGVPAYKISSSDTTNHILLEYVAKKRKPIILSTGLSTIKHVDLAVKLIQKLKMKKKLILLQTTSEYPAPNSEVNLRVIPEYIKRYSVPVGFSDHTKDYTASLGAIALGACVVEKHFTLSRKLKGPDQKSSLEPSELKEWVEKIRHMEKSLGSNRKFITKSEKTNLTMRKILVIKSAKKGTIITKNLIDSKRGNIKGVLPLEENVNRILGKKLLRNIHTPMQFSWDMV